MYGPAAAASTTRARSSQGVERSPASSHGAREPGSGGGARPSPACLRPHRPRGRADAAVPPIRRGPHRRVLERGYRLHDKLLRPARVIVAAVSHGRLLPDARRRQERLARTRSRRRSASSPASTTPTRTRATRRRRRSSRRSTRPTRRSPTRRSAPSTTSCCGWAPSTPPAAGFRPGQGGAQGFDPRIFQQGGGRSRWATWATCSPACSAAPGGRRGAAAAAAERGADIQVDVTLSFDDSLHGVTVRVPVDKPDTCGTCHGSGAKPGTTPKVCPECQGRGVMAQNQGLFALSQPCPRATATAPSSSSPAAPAAAPAWSQTRRYTVKIPAGVKDGTKIRIKGKGEAGLAAARRRPVRGRTWRAARCSSAAATIS